MFDKYGHARYKNEARVLITLTGQDPFEAAVFLRVDERLIDLLNDDRAFIPVKRGDGTTVITAKTNIVTIIEQFEDATEKEADPEPASEAGAEAADDAGAQQSPDDEAPKKPIFRPRRSFDPYEVLRVSKDATIDEIRHAYKVRIKAVHPDTIAAFDLDEDLERAANLTAQKVNHAYQRVMRERNRAAEMETEAGAA